MKWNQTINWKVEIHLRGEDAWVEWGREIYTLSVSAEAQDRGYPRGCYTVKLPDRDLFVSTLLAVGHLDVVGGALCFCGPCRRRPLQPSEEIAEAYREVFLRYAPKLYLLNSPILTGFGDWRYDEINEEEVKIYASRTGWSVESAIGHPGAAALLADILGLEIPVQRRRVELEPGDEAIVIQLQGPRLAPGEELSVEEMRARGFKLGRLRRFA
ncbi:MAG: hypothetical protein DRO01_02690 [Thermoproteota archaeon]|nr:MAG: hypothetical protein DRO01_02690 [Candidatus Korarchaeota archaeon]